MDRSEIPTIDDVKAAAERIAPHVHRTPVVRSACFDHELTAQVYFKCENLQKVGAFKARGATNAVLRLDRDAAGGGVVTHSSGNHGAALAYAASRREISCTVVMPHDAPPIKIHAVRGYGAEIIFCARDEREQVCDRVMTERGMTLIHPFEHPDVIAGQGTAALELLEQAGELDVVIAPVGGGGLLSGTTIAVTATSPATIVLGAEPIAADDAFRSMQTGLRQPAVPNPRSWADGLLTRLGQRAFDILRQARVDVVTVAEAEIVQAAWDVSQRMKQVVEPSGATVVAALRRLAGDVSGKRVGAIFSGGNTDFAWLDDPSLEKS